VVPVPEPAPCGRRPWAGRRVVLGVTGGIAAYKAVQLARDLTKLGAAVDVVMTRTAKEFVGPITFEALTGRSVHTEIVQQGRALDHIRLAREADVVCVAPATADFLARAAAGRADDLLAAILLATRAPVVICPAMNDAMWAHPQTMGNVTHLEKTLRYRIAGPASGALAYGEGEGTGRLLDPLEILEHIGRALEGSNPLANRKTVVTAGPTRESVDPVRTLTNRSSGRMGFALASAAWRRGAEVTLIAGPTALPAPAHVRVIHVETAAQMADAVSREIEDAAVLLMAAAVADFRPADPASTKIKRADGPARIELEPAPDILATTRSRRPAGMVAVGFALETGDGVAEARRKLEAKGLDFIVLNRADEAGAGFESETNHIMIIDPDGRSEDVPLDTKAAVAEVILDRVAARLSRRA
jgi:phosphopantothenoylcysteine decarboxylase / phosphopantothenate---cysteine ligase